MPAAVEHDAAEEGAEGGGEQACEDVVRHDVANRVRCKRVPRYVYMLRACGTPSSSSFTLNQ